MTRNEIFACAVDYLYKEGKITGQSELAEKTGITETTISRILNNKVKKPSEDSLRRLNAAFNNMFNPRWLRGEGGEMLADNEIKEVGKKIDEIDPRVIMAGVENLLEISAKQIKENEELRREFQSSLEELHDIVAQLKNANLVKPYIPAHPDTLGVSERTDNELKK